MEKKEEHGRGRRSLRKKLKGHRKGRRTELREVDNSTGTILNRTILFSAVDKDDKWYEVWMKQNGQGNRWIWGITALSILVALMLF